jgi:hypothetical protein
MMPMTIDGKNSWYLQLAGRTQAEDQNSRPRPIGKRISLNAGTFQDHGCALGHTNRDQIPLPMDLLRGQWLLEGYELWDALEGGEMAMRWRVSQPMLMHHLQLEALPPCALQLGLKEQPAFALSTMERNPCPAWSERIHLYQVPGKPFEASAVIYLNGNKQIASAEMFNIPLRAPVDSRGMVVFRRCWIRYTY